MQQNDQTNKLSSGAMLLGRNAALYVWRHQKALIALLFIAVVFAFLFVVALIVVATAPLWLPVFGAYWAWVLWTERDQPVFESGNE